MSLARLSVRNPVPVNLLMLAIIAVGIVSLMRLPRELMSDISFNWVFIATPYPGVSAEEIERLITAPIEDEIRDVKEIDTITSQSTEGMSFISVKFEAISDEEFRARLQDLRSEVDKVDDIPEEALDTTVQAFGSADFAPLIAVHLYGLAPEREMLELAQRLRDKLTTVDGVAKVELSGARDREIWVEADPTRLQGYGLAPQHLEMAIRMHGINVPAGRIRVGRKELIVRTVGEFANVEEIGRVIVHSTAEGRTVRVSNVADVRDSFAEEVTRNRLNTEPVVSLTVSKQAGGNSIEISDAVRQLATEFGELHSDTITVGFTQDSAELIVDILTKLTTNAWLGFAVVVILLMAVLGWRNAILAALGIPISFLAAFIFMDRNGETFNGNSLFGLVLVLGIIVDDAIIVVENCHRHLQMGKSWHQAAIDGTEEVFKPILSASLTTVAAFLPLVLLPGIMGKFMRIIPTVFCLALLASVIEAFVILPSHFADWPGRSLQMRSDREWLVSLRGLYERLLRWVVRRRFWVVVCMLLAVPVAGLSVGLVGVEMFAGEDPNFFQVRVRMPTGSNLDATSAALRDIERVAKELPAGEVRNIHSTAGLVITDDDWIFRPDVGQIWLDLPLSYGRTRSADTIMQDLRERITGIAGPTQLEVAKLNTGPPVGKPVEVKLKGKYIERVAEAAEQLKAFLRRQNGLTDVGDDLRPGSEQVRVRIDPERAALHGLTVGQVGMTLRAAVDGIDAAHLYDGDEQIDVVVRVAESFFAEPGDLLRLPIALPGGQSILLGEIAETETVTGYADIRRFQNERAVTVFADIDRSQADVMAVNERIREEFASIAKRYPEVTLDFGGEFTEFKEAFKNLAQLFLLGILLIYMILGAQFRSYMQPIVILFTVPFAFVGAVLGLLISGNPFSIATLFGMVALAGVAVNDAIVLISFLNNLRADGMPAAEAVVQAGLLRLRPVILTSATTIAGLLPMAMGLGGMSLTWGPLANTIVWGLLVATILTLVFMPAVYLVLVVDLPRKLGRGATPAAKGESARLQAVTRDRPLR